MRVYLKSTVVSSEETVELDCNRYDDTNITAILRYTFTNTAEAFGRLADMISIG